MLKNLLYYCPLEANKLYYAQKNSKEFKRAINELKFITDFPVINDDKALSIQKKIKGSIKLCLFLASFILIAAALFALSDKFGTSSDVLFVSLFLLVIIGCIVEIIVCIYSLRLRKKLINYFLESYQPVDKDDETLRLFGDLCRQTLFSIEVNCDSNGTGEADLGLVCLSCLSETDFSNVARFYKNDIPCCPYCSKASLIYKNATLSDDFLNELSHYWRRHE